MFRTSGDGLECEHQEWHGVAFDKVSMQALTSRMGRPQKAGALENTTTQSGVWRSGPPAQPLLLPCAGEWRRVSGIELRMRIGQVRAIPWGKTIRTCRASVEIALTVIWVKSMCPRGRP
jgi:hypothetical protein